MHINGSSDEGRRAGLPSPSFRRRNAWWTKGLRGTAGLRAAALLIFVLWILPGCMIVDVGVTNPLRGVNTVAVVPFFNQSSERAVDGRHLANLYATELQKVPGVEVIPVGVTERALQTYGLRNLSSPRDAAKLATLLDADAVVIGSVTEYSPYQPPRLGLSIAWYSPHRVQFDPGVPVEPEKADRIHEDLKQRRKAKFNYHKDRIIKGIERRLDEFFLFESMPPGEVIPAAPSHGTFPSGPQRLPSVPPAPPSTTTSPATQKPNQNGEADSGSPNGGTEETSRSRFRPPVVIRSQNAGSADSRGSNARTRRLSQSAGPTLRPLMTYTKIVDAADAGTAAAFRDYLELRGDARRGNWDARLLWADEFHRFAMHLMIVEMFQLHGGEARRRVVLKWRKHK